MKIAVLTQEKYRGLATQLIDLIASKYPHLTAIVSSNHSMIKWENYDLVISLLYDKIVRNNEFDIPKMGTINIHPSLLPSGRGSCPNFWAIAEGDSYAGWTAHRMTSEIDKGDIYHQLPIPVHLNDTGESLWKQLFNVLPAFLSQLANRISNNDLTPLDIEQNGKVHTLKQFHEAHNLNEAINNLASPELIVATYYVLNLIQACSFANYPGAVLDTPDGKVEFRAYKVEEDA